MLKPVICRPYYYNIIGHYCAEYLGYDELSILWLIPIKVLTRLQKYGVCVVMAFTLSYTPILYESMYASIERIAD